MDAYLDSEIDLVRSLEIEQHLKECSLCTQGYEQRRSFISAVKIAPLAYPLPIDLEQNVRAAIRRSAGEPSVPNRKPERAASWNPNSWFYGMLGAGALALVFLAAVPRLYGPSSDERLGQEIVEAHVRSLMANHLTDVQNSNQHVVKPWFNGRLDFSPTVQDFSDHGFPLVGGRLDYLSCRPAAAIVYYRAAHPINLFVWPAKPGETLREKTSTRQGYHLIRWSEGGMIYWIISDVNEHDLKDLAGLIQK
jgi:anti-sigma factor RsiW